MADKGGVTTKRKNVYIPPEKRAPYNPAYGKMSKAAVVEAEKKRKARELEISRVKADLEARDSAPKAEAPKVEEPKKKAGRPKKIE